jgi:hypothetical protein
MYKKRTFKSLKLTATQVGMMDKHNKTSLVMWQDLMNGLFDPIHTQTDVNHER